MRPNVDEIRKHFPSPISSRELSQNLGRNPMGNYYCVGGALLCYMNGDRLGKSSIEDSFPRIHPLADALRGANPSLTVHRARGLAADIMNANDYSDFDSAWAILEKALAAKEE